MYQKWHILPLLIDLMIIKEEIKYPRLTKKIKIPDMSKSNIFLSKIGISCLWRVFLMYQPQK